MATELGVSQLSTTADVTVNLLDINDNKPQFSPKPTYEINIQENLNLPTNPDFSLHFPLYRLL